MKWYSVKEHQPILSICCVLLAVHVQDSGSIYLTLGEWDGGWKEWDDKYDIEKELPGHKVLYFCYPDPIPKAYENLMEDNKITAKSSNNNSLMRECYSKCEDCSLESENNPALNKLQQKPFPN